MREQATGGILGARSLDRKESYGVQDHVSAQQRCMPRGAQINGTRESKNLQVCMVAQVKKRPNHR